MEVELLEDATDHVAPVPHPPGRARAAESSDHELVLRWWREFTDETAHEGAPGHEQA